MSATSTRENVVRSVVNVAVSLRLAQRSEIRLLRGDRDLVRRGPIAHARSRAIEPDTLEGHLSPSAAFVLWARWREQGPIADGSK
jgi:hypothetical protein